MCLFMSFRLTGSMAAYSSLITKSYCKLEKDRSAVWQAQFCKGDFSKLICGLIRPVSKTSGQTSVRGCLVDQTKVGDEVGAIFSKLMQKKTEDMQVSRPVCIYTSTRPVGFITALTTCIAFHPTCYDYHLRRVFWSFSQCNRS